MRISPNASAAFLFGFLIATINIQCGCCLLTPHFLGIAISAGKNRTVCIPFSPNAGNKPPSWQHLRLMHAFRGKNGKILAPCIHFRVQSGGFGYMARESCRQGWLFASRGLRSCMARRTRQRCSTSSWQRPAVWSNGLCALSPIPGLLDA